MEDHPRVLQQGIEVRTGLGRRKEPQERIRSGEDKEVQPEGDDEERAENARQHAFRQMTG